VYYGMDWLCPSYNQAMADRIQTYYGNITAYNTIRDWTSIVQTGDVHSVVYDLTDELLYVSFLATNNSIVPTPQMAYDRQFTQLDLASMWNEAPPTMRIAAIAATA
jgi:isopenicillin-N N-acyltransferase-like protein